MRLYAKMAAQNIRSNVRFFAPRMGTEAGLIACFYIMLTLAMDDRMRRVKGGEYLPTFMWMGVAVLALLSAVLMLYINRFLMKQRKREFGVYNVLGMEKRHVGRVLFFENLFSSLLSVAGGLGAGMIFYKLCSLVICRLLQTDAVAGFYYVTPGTVIPTAVFFLLLDFCIFIFNRISIALMKPVELLQSRSAGEKEPKVRWVMLGLGLVSLGSGYAIALATQSPLEALEVFFLAVLLVIAGTYFLFVAGSIFVLKTLKKNENFYYRSQNMPAVAGLLYRMKQNAVGLASIAILATGVLVMISTTVTLYAGYEGVLNKNYPQDLYFEAGFSKEDGTSQSLSPEELERMMRGTADKNGVEIKAIEQNEYLYAAYLLQDHTLYVSGEIDDYNMTDVGNYFFITADTYHKLSGDTVDLAKQEIAVCSMYDPSGIKDITGTLTIHGTAYDIRQNLYHFPISASYLASSFACYGVVVSDEQVLNDIYLAQKEANGKYASEMTRRIAVTFADYDKAAAVGDSLDADLRAALKEMSDEGDVIQYNLNTRWNAKEALLGMFGTLLFLGVLLGAVCLFATALIIYYKQISEGYEDRSRFQIMEKIGMSHQEVKQTIRKQVLLVFFLPLAVAGLHMAVVFPLLTRIMRVLMLFSVKLFACCTLGTFTVFALVYVLIYLGTSKTYYQIVR
ncbi:MAG: ABC transporter permease [Clostridia bacterium]|nr:ABC transporter permease [Clostridia bacterium]